MAASVYSVARNLYEWSLGNDDRIAEIRAAFDAAISAGPLKRGGLDSVSSATKNGVTMQKLVGLNEDDRITALRICLSWHNNGKPRPSTSRAVF